MENIIDALAKVLGNNRGLAEDAILCFDQLINFNDLDENISEAPEEAEELCWEEVYYIHNLMYDKGLGYLDQHWSRLEDYCKNMNPMGVPSDIVDGMAKVLLQYYKCKKETLNENMKRKGIRLNETQLRNMIAESVKKVLKEMDMSFQYEADGMINKGYEGIKNGMDIQDILDWLNEHFYELTPSQKNDFKQLWDMAM